VETNGRPRYRDGVHQPNGLISVQAFVHVCRGMVLMNYRAVERHHPHDEIASKVLDPEVPDSRLKCGEHGARHDPPDRVVAGGS
jgi:hypothetical protein